MNSDATVFEKNPRTIPLFFLRLYKTQRQQMIAKQKTQKLTANDGRVGELPLAYLVGEVGHWARSRAPHDVVGLHAFGRLLEETLEVGDEGRHVDDDELVLDDGGDGCQESIEVLEPGNRGELLRELAHCHRIVQGGGVAPLLTRQRNLYWEGEGLM